jgi:hypothetical protein
MAAAVKAVTGKLLEQQILAAAAVLAGIRMTFLGVMAALV